MTFNFNENINRKDTNCLKYDALDKYFFYSNLEPLWVADMDFKTPEFIQKPILKAVEKSIFGYGTDRNGIYEAIISWQKNRHNWNIKKEEIFLLNGVVPSYSACIEAFSNIGDEIIVQIPIYPPLFNSVKANNRRLILNELKNNDGYYTMDLEDLKSKITSKTKILCLCSPHNPVGRVWNKKELEQLAQICIKNNIIIISDEIHSDITFKPFIPIASISKTIAQITITLNSAGKTFNIAGLNTSYAISSNKELLEQLKKIALKREIHSINYLGYIGTKEAYSNGALFVDELNKYLQSNIEFTKQYLKKYCKNIEFYIPEATYLLWLDFSKTNLSHKQIKNILLTKCKIALNDGLTFGKNGEKFFRINIALNKEKLKFALNKISKEFY